MPVKLDTGYTKEYVNKHEMAAIWPQVEAAHKALHGGTGLGNAYLGWIDLPEKYDRAEFARVKEAAERIRRDADVLLVIGIGGSYLGARAAIEFCKGTLFNKLSKDSPEIYFVGNSISPDYLNEIISACEGKRICVNVISKSGTTTEPALAFRVFREMVECRHPEDAHKRIYCTTDKSEGTLFKLAKDKVTGKGYETFVIPDDVGGRYSVLTPVGLLPMAVAGIDIDAAMQGAADARKAFLEPDIEKNHAYRYAAMRNILRNKGFAVEVLVSYEPAFTMMNEWYKQLFGESEGKDHKGLYPSSMVFSTDLHSLGQFVQDGARIMFETVVHVGKPKNDVKIHEEPGDIDGLNFLAGKNMSFVNDKAFEGTVRAHLSGGVPNMVLELPEMNPYEFGYLVYFFEKACAISGYMLGVNPFEQDGVEEYKKNMFALLGKPGYEERKAALEADMLALSAK